MDLGGRRLFLSSNSIYKDLGYLEHTIEDMLDFLGNLGQILFVPFAAVSERATLNEAWAQYAESPRKAFGEKGIDVISIHTAADKSAAVARAAAIFIGGGNTHHLLYWLREFDLLDAIRREMLNGKPMMGSSAGTNIFCPTISTTNDMPIISNPSFEAINAIPFQINPHYLDPDPDSDHRGETREQRIREFLKVNGVNVLGMREGSWLRVEDGRIVLKGLSGARLFTPSDEPREFMPENDGFDLTDTLLSV